MTVNIGTSNVITSVRSYVGDGDHIAVGSRRSSRSIGRFQSRAHTRRLRFRESIEAFHGHGYSRVISEYLIVGGGAESGRSSRVGLTDLCAVISPVVLDLPSSSFSHDSFVELEEETGVVSLAAGGPSVVRVELGSVLDVHSSRYARDGDLNGGAHLGRCHCREFSWRYSRGISGLTCREGRIATLDVDSELISAVGNEIFSNLFPVGARRFPHSDCISCRESLLPSIVRSIFSLELPTTESIGNFCFVRFVRSVEGGDGGGGATTLKLTKN